MRAAALERAADWIGKLDDDGTALKVICCLYSLLGLFICLVIVTCGYSCYLEIQLPTDSEEEQRQI